jgi:hypothetical protein
MTAFEAAARRALATFLFSFLGVLMTVPLVDASVDVWLLALGSGIGALLNLAYRWAEAEVGRGPDA